MVQNRCIVSIKVEQEVICSSIDDLELELPQTTAISAFAFVSS